MAAQETHLITGAFGYSGRYIARRLLDAGVNVRTLTNSPDRPNPFGGRVAATRFHFDDPDRMAESMRGASVLYNTYWVRFNHKDFTHESAVANTLALFTAAAAAGVRRVVHVSITNASEQSPLEYFSGKGRLERALIESGLSYSILRPAVLFGEEDVLINNIAWVLRNFPFFGVFGDGAYRIRPIYVDDLASLAVSEGLAARDRIIDAVGPETFTYRELVETIGAIIGIRKPVLSVPPTIGYAVCRVLGIFVRDVVVTREEIDGLMADLLHTDAPPAGSTRLTEWAVAHAASLGREYTSELARRRNRRMAYAAL